MELKKVKKSRKVIFAILSVVCIVLSFLSPIGVYAADNETLVDRFGLSDDDVLNNQDFANSDEYVDGLTPYINNTNTDYSNFTSYITNNLFDLPTPQEGLDSVYMAYNNFFMWEQNTTSSALMFVPDDSFMSYEGGRFYFYVNPETYSSDTGITQSNNYALNTYNFSSGVFSGRGSYSFGFASRVTIDGTTYYRLNQFDSKRVFLTNMPIYYNGGSALTTLEGVDNINYSSLGQTTDYSDLLDHLTLYENSKMYISAGSFNDGTLYIYPIFDDTQLQHSDSYSLRLVGSCQYTVYSNSSADTIMTWGNQKTRNLYNIGQISKTIDGTLSSDNGSYLDIPIDDISNGVYSISLNDLNNSFVTSYDYTILPLASSLSTGYDNYITTFSKFVSGISLKSFSIDPTKIYDGDIDIICSSCLYHFDLYVANGDNLSSSPVLSWDSDFVSGSGSSNFENLSNLEDVQNATGSGSDSLPAEYYFSGDVPSYNNSISGGGSSSSSSSPSTSTSQGGDSNNNITTGDNNQVVNTGSTNVTVNNDNGTAKYVPTILNKLLPNSEGDGGLSNDVQDLVNSNGWVTFMKTTYSFIPAAFWDKIVLYFGACLTITACAFLLRIILDLL